MSLEKLHREKMYVLGPLEISPGQFAVGERSYAAIKRNMPYYNDMRQKFYESGQKEFGDAIGELETRALKAEESLAQMTSAHKSAVSKNKALTEEMEKLKKLHASEIRKLKKDDKKKSVPFLK